MKPGAQPVLHRGDCLAVMRSMPDSSVDSIVTDPPYGIRFMGKAWDGTDIEKRAAERRANASTDPTAGPAGGHNSLAAEAGKYDLTPKAMRAFQEFTREWAAEAMRVLKPGGYALVFASTRTYHRMTCGLEDAGFEIRDQIGWAFGSGFPKSHNLDGDWEGWGTALKPAWEPICVARKPLIGTVAANVLAHGTGALNIDACRVEGVKGVPASPRRAKQGSAYGDLSNDPGTGSGWDQNVGRWPANLVHDGSDEVLAAFPDAPGQQADASTASTSRKNQNVYGAMARGNGRDGEDSANSANSGAVGFRMKPGARRLDSGSAARFFYCAKASREDRNEGLPASSTPAVSAGATMREREQADWPARNGNFHPTVKPTDLMRWLLRLVTPPGGTALDPFMGSGSTGKAAVLEGFDFIGIEKDEDEAGQPLGYMAIAQARIAFAQRQDKPTASLFDEQPGLVLEAREGI